MAHVRSIVRRALSSTGRTRSEWLAEHLQSPQSGKVFSEEEIAAMDKRLRMAMFRSSQRGWLELDVLLGRYAASRLQDLASNEGLLQQFEQLLDAEAPNVFVWATGQEEPPEEFHDIVHDVRDFVFGNIAPKKE